MRRDHSRAFMDSTIARDFRPSPNARECVPRAISGAGISNPARNASIAAPTARNAATTDAFPAHPVRRSVKSRNALSTPRPIWPRSAARTIPWVMASRQRRARNPVASSRSRSTISKPALPYGCHASTVPSGRATADVVGDPSLEQFTDAKKHVFSAAGRRWPSRESCSPGPRTSPAGTTRARPRRSAGGTPHGRHAARYPGMKHSGKQTRPAPSAAARPMAASASTNDLGRSRGVREVREGDAERGHGGAPGVARWTGKTLAGGERRCHPAARLDRVRPGPILRWSSSFNRGRTGFDGGRKAHGARRGWSPGHVKRRPRRNANEPMALAA